MIYTNRPSDLHLPFIYTIMSKYNGIAIDTSGFSPAELEFFGQIAFQSNRTSSFTPHLVAYVQSSAELTIVHSWIPCFWG